MSLAITFKSLILISLLNVTNVMAQDRYFCLVQEQTNEWLDADYGYDFVKQQDIKLDSTGSSMHSIGPNKVSPSIVLGEFQGIHFSVSYEKGIPRLTSNVAGVITQNQAAGTRATSIVTRGKWTVIVSCDKN